MKYYNTIVALFVAIASSQAAEIRGRALQEAEDEDQPTFRQNFRDFLSATFNTMQARNIEVPTIGAGDSLVNLDCQSTGVERDFRTCSLLGGVEGLNVCRNIGGVDVTVCAPKFLGNYVGTKHDQCGCCGEDCYTEDVPQCSCPCQEGRGVLVNHDIVKLFGRQVSWKACYTPNIANTIMNARPEFSCYDGCLSDTGGTEDEGTITGGTNETAVETEVEPEPIEEAIYAEEGEEATSEGGK